MAMASLLFAGGHIVITGFRQNYLTALELLAAYGSATLLHPISFLIVFFCLSHSPRHLYHAYREIGFDDIRSFIWRAVPLTLASLAIFGVIYWLFQTNQLPDNMLRSILILLSVLTVPHMALISYVDDH
jgi:Brp/Blh family beta-carotene 15,15'-monooxygenase